MQVQEKQADNYKSFINTLSLGLLISLLIFVRLYNHFSFPSSFVFLSFFLRWSLCWNFFLLDSIPGFLSNVTVTMTCTPRIIAKLNFLTEERIHFICLWNVTPLCAVFDFVNDQLISWVDSIFLSSHMTCVFVLLCLHGTILIFVLKQFLLLSLHFTFVYSINFWQGTFETMLAVYPP